MASLLRVALAWGPCAVACRPQPCSRTGRCACARLHYTYIAPSPPILPSHCSTVPQTSLSLIAYAPVSRKGFIPYGSVSSIYRLSQRRCLQPLQNKTPSIFPDYASTENSAGKLSESNAEISCGPVYVLQIRSFLLKKSFSRSRSSIQFYFIISQARSTAACTDHDLLLNMPIC
eukprot:SAG25_NODE_260_length_10806_cov_39.327356_3_plen_174_part_00